jgi:hypothetical protein
VVSVCFQLDISGPVNIVSGRIMLGLLPAVYETAHGKVERKGYLVFHSHNKFVHLSPDEYLVLVHVSSELPAFHYPFPYKSYSPKI